MRTSNCVGCDQFFHSCGRLEVGLEIADCSVEHSDFAADFAVDVHCGVVVEAEHHWIDVETNEMETESVQGIENVSKKTKDEVTLVWCSSFDNSDLQKQCN